MRPERGAHWRYPDARSTGAGTSARRQRRDPALRTSAEHCFLCAGTTETVRNASTHGVIPA